MAISIISHTTATGSSNTAIVNKPADVQNGDVLVAHITNRGPYNMAPPANWVEEYDNEDEGSETQIALAYKIITNAGGEPASYTFTLVDSAAWCGAIVCLRGVDTADPWEVDGRNSGEDDSPVAPSVASVKDNSMLLCFVSMSFAITFTPPTYQGTPMTEQYDFANAANCSCTMAYAGVVAGATGNRTFDASTDEWWSAVAAVLNPVILILRRRIEGE